MGTLEIIIVSVLICGFFMMLIPFIKIVAACLSEIKLKNIQGIIFVFFIGVMTVIFTALFTLYYVFMRFIN